MVVIFFSLVESVQIANYQISIKGQYQFHSRRFPFKKGAKSQSVKRKKGSRARENSRRVGEKGNGAEEKKTSTKFSTLEIGFSANFHLKHELYFRGGSLISPKIGKYKDKVTNIN